MDEEPTWTVRTRYENAGDDKFIPERADGKHDPCEECGQSVDEEGVSLEAPNEYIEAHLDDSVRVLMVWHRSCFEKKYGVQLPKF